MRLSGQFRWGLYSALTLMFVTGIAWLVADWLKSAPGSDVWQATAASLLMVHGGGAMVTLLLLGALLPLHAYRGWRVKRNRTSGTVMVTLNSVLIATSFGLYYAGSEVVRHWLSDIHIGAGLCLLPSLPCISSSGDEDQRETISTASGQNLPVSRRYASGR